MKQQQKSSKITIGLDLGDRRHRFCVLDKSGEVVEEGSVGNDRVFLSGLSARYLGALVVMEAGCHSPWISRYLEEQGCRVLIANPRKLRAIYQHERKSDRRDAQMLARIGRATVAVARKLAVLLLSLWKHQRPYQPFPLAGGRLNLQQTKEDRRFGTIAVHRLEAL